MAARSLSTKPSHAKIEAGAAVTAAAAADVADTAEGVRIVLSGATGRMGQTLAGLIADDDSMSLAGGIVRAIEDFWLAVVKLPPSQASH